MKGSLENYQLPKPDEAQSGIKSPRKPSSSLDAFKKKPVKSPPISRSISQVSPFSINSNQPAELDGYVDGHTSRREPWQRQMDGAHSSEGKDTDHEPIATSKPAAAAITPYRSIPEESLLDGDGTTLPQSISRLDLEIVNFFCDILQEDTTAEQHILEPPSISQSLKRSRGVSWKREKTGHIGYPPPLKLQWELFIEQSIFHTLSDPHNVLKSFRSPAGLYDSMSLWYCMLRLTRVSPSTVFHSLWMAAERLFAPPKQLLSRRSPTAKVFPKAARSITSEDAGELLTICFYALVAGAPLLTESRELLEMSRIRAHGMSLAGSGAVARQPTSLCLQYEDAFSDPLALRLARRLFSAITARQYFDELVAHHIDSDNDVAETNVLDILLSRLDLLDS